MNSLKLIGIALILIGLVMAAEGIAAFLAGSAVNSITKDFLDSLNSPDAVALGTETDITGIAASMQSIQIIAGIAVMYSIIKTIIALIAVIVGATLVFKKYDKEEKKHKEKEK
ncbi:MAG: hypothetical protein AB1467_03525 [Candidatus Diapherotrites archaeon]